MAFILKLPNIFFGDVHLCALAKYLAIICRWCQQVIFVASSQHLSRLSLDSYCDVSLRSFHRIWPIAHYSIYLNAPAVNGDVALRLWHRHAIMARGRLMPIATSAISLAALRTHGDERHFVTRYSRVILTVIFNTITPHVRQESTPDLRQ